RQPGAECRLATLQRALDRVGTHGVLPCNSVFTATERHAPLVPHGFRSFHSMVSLPVHFFPPKGLGEAYASSLALIFVMAFPRRRDPGAGFAARRMMVAFQAGVFPRRIEIHVVVKVGVLEFLVPALSGALRRVGRLVHGPFSSDSRS